MGRNDEAFIPDQFEPVISQYAEVQAILLPGVTHMGVVTGPEVRPVVQQWLDALLDG